MGEKAKSWCGIAIRKDRVDACLLCEGREKQVRRYPNEPVQYQSLAQWLEAEGCTHVALNPLDDSWKELQGVLQKRFAVRVIEQMAGASEDRRTSCEWLASLIRSGRLERTDQVEPIGDRGPNADDALGG
jgi:hypothetical protein